MTTFYSFARDETPLLFPQRPYHRTRQCVQRRRRQRQRLLRQWHRQRRR
ncbi:MULTISPECIES: hypothetical protein [Oceanimonas]|nr:MULTISPECIES: hypothetical protein [Oceanimonas]MDV2856965.1 hypothetical protein [Oceanimonas sp. CAM02]